MSDVSNQLKAFLIAIPCLLLMMVIATCSSDEMQAIPRPERAIDVEAERAQRNAARQKEADDALRTEAITGAQYYVKEKLKSPRSAKFPWSYDAYQITHLADDQYKITSYVDAQNKYGALIRHTFTVHFYRPAPERWQILDLQIKAR